MILEKHKKLDDFMSANRFKQYHLADALGINYSAMSNIMDVAITEEQQDVYIKALKEKYKC